MRIPHLLGAAAAAAFACAAPSAHAVPGLKLTQIGQHESGFYDAGGAEIVAYNALTRRTFVVNAQKSSVDVLDVQKPSKPKLIKSLDVTALGASANSVATNGLLVAVAIEAQDKQANGVVALFNAVTLKGVHTIPVGALPDMVTISDEGRYVLVANEGEPNGDYTVDPEGSVSIIDLWAWPEPRVRTVDFRAFNGKEAQLRAKGIRIFGPNATAAQDFEPEYITVSGDKAYVTLQENNAIAVIDIKSAKVKNLLPLGYKDHLLLGNKLDASDRDNAINIVNWPVRGLYMPDGIASYRYRGKTYLVTANEGDARDYDGFAEEQRISATNLDTTAFPNAAQLKANSALGRLNRTTTLGDTDGDGDVDALYVLGGRSFSIWDESGKQVFDSGSDFESITANLLPQYFNASNDDNTFDSRSDNKGPEPEGVTLGQVGARTYAFIGLERIGGIMVYDVTNPRDVSFVTYVNNRDFSAPVCQEDSEGECVAPNPAAGDLGPEGLEFVPWYLSPTWRPLLIVGNEVSGTTTVYQVDQD